MRDARRSTGLQGADVKALFAELLAGELARRLGLSVPELVLVELDPALGRAEPDPEIQDMLDASPGLNLGVDFLPGALSFDPADAHPPVAAELAADIVWSDALVTNVDRTPRNPNLLLWHERLWLIDHGAAVYHQHASGDLAAQARAPFPAIGQHVLLPHAGSILEADERLAPRVSAELPEELAALVPDEWQELPREAYAAWLERRLARPRAWKRSRGWRQAIPRPGRSRGSRPPSASAGWRRRPAPPSSPRPCTQASAASPSGCSSISSHGL